MRSQVGLGSIDPTTDVDWWKFDALAGDSVDIFSQRTSGSLDPYIILYRLNDAGDDVTSIDQDGSGGPGITDYISGRELSEDGTYYIRVLRNSGSANSFGGYDLRVNLNRLHDIETDQNYRNDSVVNSDQIVLTSQGEDTFIGSVAGTIMPGQSSNVDEDTFSLGTIEADNTALLTITLPPWSAIDPVIDIRNSLNEVISTQTSTNGSVVRLDIAEDGVYYATVVDRGDGDLAGQYLLQASIQPTDALDFVDLQVTDVTAPATASSGEQIVVSWMGVNAGAVDLAPTTWSDRIYLSADSELGNADDVVLGTFTQARSLTAGGGDYADSQTVMLPPGIQGNYQIFVRTDAMNDVPEFIFEANNVSTSDNLVTVSRTPSADLHTSDVVTPALAFVGEPATVTWTVTNGGTGTTGDGTPNGTVNSWLDRIFVSTDDVYGNADDVLIAEVPHDGVLAPGENYAGNWSGTVPTGLDGSYRWYVRTDAEDAVYEFEDALSNISETDELLIAPSQFADLIPTEIGLPATATSGQPIPITWNTANDGFRDTTGPWIDRFYLSTDDIYSADDVLIDSEIINQLIAIDGSANFSTELLLPERIEGDFHLILVVNADQAEYEFLASDNNTIASAAISVTRRLEPDLVPEIVESPTTIQLNVPFDFSYTVSNRGVGDTVGTWIDRLYLSSDSAVDEDDLMVAEIASSPDSLPLIPAGAPYRVTDSFTIPFGFDPGSYNLLLVADADQTELETDELNNTIVLGPLSVELPPLPDLVVTGIVAPPSALSGQQIPITWTISNQGEAPFSGSFGERIFLSSDDQIGDDQAFGTFTFTGEIPVGGSVERTQLITLPGTLSEDRFVVIATDIESEVFEGDGEANNVAIDDAPIALTLQPFPNLIVSNVTVPDTAFSGQSTGVSWTVENIGTRGTNAPIWNDSVYLSTDTVFDPQFDVFLGRTPNQSFLDVGSSYRTEDFQVTLPRGINGPYYFLVIADSDSRVNEFGGEDDNISSAGPTDVTLTPPPDLIVESIVAPAMRISGETARIDWVVRNQGTGSTRTDAWNDRVFLSTDQVLDQDDRPLALVNHRGELLPGETYAATAEFAIPLEVSGDFFFIVETDAVTGFAGGNVFEHVFEENNTIASETPTTIIQGALPDLEVTSVTVPNGARSGELLEVTYTVENLGQTTTQTTAWTDAIYLSSDDQFDPSDDFFLTSTAHFGALTADFTEASRYTSTVSGRVPDELAGTFFVFVVTDSRNGVLELSDDNNTGVSATTTSFTQSPADLSSTQLSVPPSAVAGGTFLANWSVQNVGSGSTIISRWTDNVVLSTDEVFGNGDDITLLRRSHNGLIEAGQSYDVANQAVEIPFSVSPGEYFLFLQADSGERVFEDGQRANNVSSPAPLSIGRDTPDLQVTSLTTADTGEAGRPFNIQWSVTNTGTGATNANFWADRIYLSQDTTISLNDIRLAEVQRTNPLGSGQSYSRNRNFAIPLDAVGEYFVLVQTDARNSVIEGAGESNNATGTSQVVRFAEFDPDGTGGDGPRPPADLVVTNVDAPADGVSGQTIDVSWSVRNDAFMTDGEWFDSVYLSLDQVFNRDGDVYLGFANRPNDLAIGESYTQSATFPVPRGLSGPYYVFVSTDGSDRIPEVGSVANNVARDLQPIELTLPPPVDLAVGTITVPASAALNQVASVSYTVSNLSTEAINGSWTDRLYISADGQWDIGDRLFGSVDVSGPITGNTSYSRTIEAPLPGVVPGDYHVIVRSDIRNQIAEADEDNNLAASVDRTDVDVESLTLGLPVTSNLGDGQSLFYKIDVEKGETLLFELDSDNADAVNELYVSFGEIPTRSEADFTFANALAPNQRIVVSVTEAGTYYMLAHGQQNTDDQSITIEANTIDFTVFDESFGRGGNIGDRTISISGAKFDRTLTATLIDAVGTRIPAQQIWHDTSIQSYATFDLRGLAPGFYDVEVATESAGSILVEDSLEVVAGGGGLAEVQIDAPSRVGIGARYAVEFAWANDGLNDAPAPFVLVGNTTPLFLTPTGGNLGLFYEFVGINQNGGPKGILKPGDFGTLTLYSQASLQAGFDVPLTTRQLANRDAIFDWDAVKPGLRPSNLSSQQYDEVFGQLIANVGTTNGDILDSLAKNASLISSYLGAVPTFYELMDLEIVNALAELTTSVTGRVQANSFQIAIGGEQLRLVHASTNEAYLAETRIDGEFVFHSLDPGVYRIDYSAGYFDDNLIEVEAGIQSRGIDMQAFHGSQIALTATDEAGRFIDDFAFDLLDEDDSPVSTFSTENELGVNFSNLRPGSYKAIVRAEGFATVEIEGIEVLAEDVSLQLQLQQESVITGSLVAVGQDPSAISIVAFPIEGGSASIPFQATFQNGIFRIGGLSQGVYDLEINEEGAVPVRLEGVAVNDGSLADVGTISLVAAATVSGVVIVEDSAIVGNDAVATLESMEGLVVSAPVANNQFVIDAVPPGTYELSISGADFGRSVPQLLEVELGTDISDLSIQLMEDSSIAGTVRLATGEFAEGVLTVLERVDGGDSFSTVTSQEGTFSIIGVPNADYVVYVSGQKESTSQLVSITSSNASIGGIVLQLGDSSRLTGEVTSNALAGLANAVVSVLQDGVLIATTPTNDQGRFSFLFTKAGRYELSVDAIGSSFFVPQVVDVNLGSDQVIDFDSGNLTLSISNSSGESIENVTLSQLDGLNSISDFTTSDVLEPSLDVQGLVPGVYRLSIVTSSGTHDQIVVVAEDSSVEFSVDDIQSVSILGSLNASDLELIRSASIYLASSDGVISPRVISIQDNGDFSAEISPNESVVLRIVIPSHEEIELQFNALANVDIGELTPFPATGSLVGAIKPSTFNTAVPPIVLLLRRGVVIASTGVAFNGDFAFDAVVGDDISVVVLSLGNKKSTEAAITVEPGNGVNIGSISAESSILVIEARSDESNVSTSPASSFSEVSDESIRLAEGESIFSRFVPEWLKPFLGSEIKASPLEVRNRPEVPEDCDCGNLDTQLSSAIGRQARELREVFDSEERMLQNAGYVLLTFLQGFGQASLNGGVALFKATTLSRQSVLAFRELGTLMQVANDLTPEQSQLSKETLGALTALAGTDNGVERYKNIIARAKDAGEVDDYSELVAQVLRLGNSISSDVARFVEVVARMAGQSELFPPRFRMFFDRIETIFQIKEDLENAFAAVSRGLRTSTGSFNAMRNDQRTLELQQQRYLTAVADANALLSALNHCIERCKAERDDNQPDPDPDPDPNPNDPDPPRPQPKPQPLDDDALEPEPGDDDDPTDDDEPGDDGQPGNGDNPNGGNSPIRRNPILRFFNSDPNDILGPDGFGEQRWVSVTDDLQYRIRFENDPLVANAPVQQLRITQTLDSDLDPRSFRLGDFGIGETVFSVPANVAAFSKRFDRVEEDGIFIDVVAGIDIASREVFWEILAIDPATGLEPFDPLLGFLPPNLMPPEGDGFVTYSVRPSRTSITGDIIDAEARIIFDINEPIDTPPIFNTIDAVAPTSEVDALPSQVTETTFDVSWSGTDDEDGSAVASYDVFVSINDGPYEKWLGRTTLTTAQYVGELGHTYAFYSVARDNAGKIEAIPQAPDALASTPPAPDDISPTVIQTVIQAGMTQRSYVDLLTFTFDEATNLEAMIADGAITGAVTLTNLGVNADTDTDVLIPLTADQFRYTFDEETGTSQITWSLDQFAGGRQSLEDGFYQVTFAAAQVTDLAGNRLDGNADGTAGDDYSFYFHKLTGDADGNGVVDALDRSIVLDSLGRFSNTDDFDANADLDRDGRISVRDRIIATRANGQSIAPPNGMPLSATQASAPAPIAYEDTNRDGRVSALDALVVINHLGRQQVSMNSSAEGEGPSASNSQYDVNGDGAVSALDALLVINRLSQEYAASRAEFELVSAARDSARSVDHVFLSPSVDADDDEDDQMLRVLADDQQKLRLLN
ncbi:carboxypeptidase regulatory-like domain-containing protein [Stieleria sp. JC731]|nr:CARDB domain-containing protein [Stieleria sp. JC731]MCC9601047.1 carboxypeptidase regulatory-like domain-containing protein [Stieleria sp. JC731]